MKLTKPRSQSGSRAIWVRFLTITLTAASPVIANADDYFDTPEQHVQGVQLASDTLEGPYHGHAERMHGSQSLDNLENIESHSESVDSADVYPDAIHAESVPGEEWIDPTVTETCECEKAAGMSCPGVCKDPGHPKKPKHPRPGDIDEGDCPSMRYRMNDCLRSGDPNCVYKWAAPSITPKYSAWFVGGGAAFKGRGRKSSEGTWGLDYDGVFGHARNWLNYTCGKEQGGEGAYETDHVPLKKKF